MLNLAIVTGHQDGDGWAVSIGLRDLGIKAVITSKAGLTRSIGWLVENGMIDIIDRGEPDANKECGRRAQYRVRYLGTNTPEFSRDIRELHQVGGPSSSDKFLTSQRVCPHLPDAVPIFDFGDAMVSEPQYLRLIDMAELGMVPPSAIESPSRVGELLGITRQSAWEMLRRWECKEMLVDIFSRGPIPEMVVDALAAAKSRIRSLTARVRREETVRTSVHTGAWTRVTARVGRRFGKKKSDRRLRPVEISVDTWNRWVQDGEPDDPRYSFVPGVVYSII